jgi:hypothetical protein
MSIEIKTPDGKSFGMADREDGQDFVVVNNKRVALSDVYQDKELFDNFNDEITTSEKELKDDQ